MLRFLLIAKLFFKAAISRSHAVMPMSKKSRCASVKQASVSGGAYCQYCGISRKPGHSRASSRLSLRYETGRNSAPATQKDELRLYRPIFVSAANRVEVTSDGSHNREPEGLGYSGDATIVGADSTNFSVVSRIDCLGFECIRHDVNVLQGSDLKRKQTVSGYKALPAHQTCILNRC